MARGPNILWILTTQWRAQALGFAADANARTPNLDALATQATWYRQAVTPHPFGPFARAALLTGIRSPVNGVADYFDPLPPRARTIAHELAELGYGTSFFGKWHLGRRDRAAALVGETHARTVIPPDLRGGFALWEGFEGGFLLNDPWLHGSRLPEPVKFTGYQSEVVCARAADYLTERNALGPGQPWFSIVSLEAPHPPYAAPAAGVLPRNAEGLELTRNVPRGGAVEARARTELAGYYAHIEATDGAVGRLIARLDGADRGASGARTIVVFTSVHGDMHGAHGLFRKGWPYEESVRVPFLVRGDGFQAGKVSDELVSLDQLPELTLCWADRGTRARSLDRPQRISMPSVVALPDQCDRRWRGVRTLSRKLILNEDGSPWLFFDLASDPFELVNLAFDPRHETEIAALGALV